MQWTSCPESRADQRPRFSSSPLLLLADVHRSARLLPVQVHGASRPGLIEANGEILHRRGQWRHPHIHPSKVFSLARIRNTPLPGLLADNQDPLVGVWHSKERVASCRDILASDVQVRVRDQRGGIVGSGPPNFAVRHQSAKYLAAFHARTGVVRLDGLTV